MGSRFATLGANVPAFINILNVNVLEFISHLRPNNKPKMLKVLVPHLFGPLTPNLKWALDYITFLTKLQAHKSAASSKVTHTRQNNLTPPPPLPLTLPQIFLKIKQNKTHKVLRGVLAAHKATNHFPSTTYTVQL